MKSLFKSLFRSEPLKNNQGLNHVSNLQPGDMVELDNDFSLPELLRGRTFQVAQKCLYEYEDTEEVEWVLKNDENATIFLSHESEDGDEVVSIGIKLTPEDVESIFNLDEFSTIFDDEYSAQLVDISPTEKYSGWLGSKYSRTAYAEPGCYHKSGKIVDSGEPFDYFSLTSHCSGFDIGIEVWEGGETDVLIYIKRPLRIIKHYWGQQNT